jgi:DNA-binding NarL/FixJ family response regulator
VSLIRVILVDDHALVRAGMRALLANMAGVEVVAEAVDGHAALEAIRTHAPDLVLMDISMPNLNGLEATAQATREFPDTRIIVLSAHSSEEYVGQALRAGASGYLLKDAPTVELELAIKSVAKGETYLSPAVSKHVISSYVRRVGGEAGSLELLTPRQRETLQLVAEGKSTKEIARILHVSVKTIETHRAQLMDRLDIHDVAGLVRYAIRIGLVKNDE